MQDEMDVMAILDMVSSGKISPDEGVELLEALKASHPKQSTPYEPRDTRKIADLRATFEDIGLDDIDFEELNQLRNFGLTPQKIREFNELGVAPRDVEDWESVSIHKVTPSYVREMIMAGMKEVKIDELVNARIHRVTPDIVREFNELGYVDLPMDDLVEFLHSPGSTGDGQSLLKKQDLKTCRLMNWWSVAFTGSHRSSSVNFGSWV